AWGLALLGLAVGAAVVQWGFDSPPWDFYAAGAVVLVGVVAVVTAPLGGAPSLVVCGFLLAGGVGVAAASDIALDGGAGDRRYAPETVAELRERYELGAGSMTLDLSQLELPPGTTEIEAEIGFGEILIDTPPDGDVEVHATANAADVVLFGERSDGLDIDASHVSEGSGSARLVIDAHVGFGSLEVERGTP
ncbi:MAG TPA: LiaF domain-containing protein, partial [Capillimicrobium sp.]